VGRKLLDAPGRYVKELNLSSTARFWLVVVPLTVIAMCVLQWLFHFPTIVRIDYFVGITWGVISLVRSAIAWRRPGAIFRFVILCLIGAAAFFLLRDRDLLDHVPTGSENWNAWCAINSLPVQNILCRVFIVGIAWGLIGLVWNEVAISGLRSIPWESRVGPKGGSRLVVLPLIVAAALVALSYQGGLRELGLVSNDHFLSLWCVFLHAVVFAVLLSGNSIRRLCLAIWYGTAPEWWFSVKCSLWQIIYSLLGGAALGVLISLTYELLRFADQQPWLRATIGPPLFLVDIFLGFTVLVALLGGSISELEREWWGRLTGLLLRAALLTTRAISSYWLIVFGVVVYGPPVLDGLGAVGKALLGAIWATITGKGVLAGQSSKTGTGQEPWYLAWLCSVAPPVFLIGLLTVLSYVSTPALDGMFSWCDAPSAAAARQSCPAGIPLTSPNGTTTTNSRSEKAETQLDPFWKAVNRFWKTLTNSSPKKAETQPDSFWLNFDRFCQDFNLATERHNHRHDHWWLLPTSLLVPLLLGILFLSVVDVNIFSLNSFYANRLVRAFLGASRPKEKWVFGRIRG
jgi:hypothetical protein